MKIFVRQHGHVVAEIEPEPGRSYLLGRAKECDIRLTAAHVSRRHGRLFEADGEWHYEDLRTPGSPPHPLGDDHPLSVEQGVDLVTESYVASQKTSEIEASPYAPPPSKSRALKYAAAGLLAILLGGAGGYLIYQTFYSPMSVSDLLDSIRPQVVELEWIRDEEVIEQLKKYAKLKDEDFKRNVGFCSGFIVEKNVVLTASHCVLGPYGTDIRDDFTVKTHDQKVHRPSRILGFDLQRDYLFLEVPGLDTYGRLEFEPGYKIGEKVYTVGNVHGEGIAIREGIAASKTKDEIDPTIEFLRYSAAASPGNSGGPLVNAYRKVVGLVFARGSFSENYNKAADAKDLMQGMEIYVKRQEPKKAVFEAKKIPGFHYSHFLPIFGFEVDYNWETDPDLAKPFTEIKVDIDVPTPLEGFAKSANEALSAAFKEKYDLVLAAFQKKKKSGGEFAQGSQGLFPEPEKVEADWTVHASGATPLILPSPQYDRMSIVEANGDFLAEDRFALYLPADYYNYDDFKRGLKEYKSYNYRAGEIAADLRRSGDQPEDPTQHQQDKKGDGIPAGRLSYESNSWDRRGIMTSSLGSRAPFVSASLNYMVRENFEAGRLPAETDRNRMILGEEGLVLSYFRNPFLKTELFSGIKVSELPPPSISEIQDTTGRKWSRASWKLFGEYEINQYCLPLPEGYSCLTVSNALKSRGMRKEDTPDLFVQKTLSQVMVRPQFWHLPAVLDYRRAGHSKNLQAWDDVELSETPSGELEIKLLTAGVTFMLPAGERPLMLRIVPALHHNKGQPRWIAVGFTGYYPGAEKGSMKFCGADLQMSGVPPYLDSVRREQEVSRDVEMMQLLLYPDSGAAMKKTGKTDTGRKLTRQELRIASLQQEASLVTFCQEAKKEGARFRFGDYEGHPIPHQIP